MKCNVCGDSLDICHHYGDKKLKEYWIRFGSASNGGPFPEPKVYREDPKLSDGFGGVTIHVREVSPALDAAHIKCERALEALAHQEKCHYEAGSHTWSHDSDCVKCKALIELKNARKV